MPFSQECASCNAPFADLKFEDSVEDVKQETQYNRVVLVASPTCANCMIVKSSLKEANVSFEVLMATENRDFCIRNRVMSAPTLLLMKDDEVVTRFKAVPEILNWIKEQ